MNPSLDIYHFCNLVLKFLELLHCDLKKTKRPTNVFRWRAGYRVQGSTIHTEVPTAGSDSDPWHSGSNWNRPI